MSASKAAETLVVVTGSSAGGIEALIAFINGLPSQFGGCVVIAQHHAASQPGRLAEVLSRKTALRIVTIEGTEPLEPGKILLSKAGCDVTIVDGAASVQPISDRGPRPSIDRLFTTAAEQHGDRVVGIIFSGMGSDGVEGARAVKESDGIVIVQEPDSAAFPHMPLAIPPTLVDFSARPEAIGSIVDRLARNDASPLPDDDDRAMGELLAQLHERSGVDFSLYKKPTISRRLSRLMVASGASSIAEYARHLEENPDSFRRLVGTLLIKVTEFFRDAALFDALRLEVIPELLVQAKKAGRELRVWCAGTSTGEETYSIAILCAEIIRERGEEIPVRIFGTDLDDHAVAFARRGLYSVNSVRHVPASWLERYFVQTEAGYEVSKRIRNMTVFGQHDLGQRAPFPRIDLCLCRNVLIYFTRELQMRALQLFSFSLRDGGYLVVGKAEGPSLLSEYYQVVDPTLKIYRRQGQRNVIPPARFRENGSQVTLPLAVPMQRVDRPRIAVGNGAEMVPAGQAVLGSVSNSPVIGSVVVDRRYDIVTLNAMARSMLEIHGIGVGDDFLHQVHNIDTNRLRNLIDATFAGESGKPMELELVDASGEARWMLVSSVIDRGVDVALFFVDVTTIARDRIEAKATAGRQTERIDEAERRIDDILRRQRALLLANDQLSEANVELLTANEQLLISAEESASASEEIETLNEEMQATNEELETLNEELQATVEELNTSNDELSARSGDLERLVEARQAEMLRTLQQRESMLDIFERFAGPFAIVVETTEAPSFMSPSFDRVGFAALAPGWSNGVTLDLAGKAFRIDREHTRSGTFVFVRPIDAGADAGRG